MRSAPRQLDAIAGLYAVFGRYPLRAIEACPCCASSEDVSRLSRLPLRQLSNAHLSPYAAKALTTWGDERDFKHFLPRLFELAVDADTWPLDLPHLAVKLRYAEWSVWPESERAAIAELYSAALEAAIHATPPSRDLSEMLDSVEPLGIDSGAMLDATFQAMHGAALSALVQLAERSLGLPKRPLRSWSAWLRSDALRARVQQATVSAADADREQLAYLITLLDSLRAATA
jgi:hypothetical protein